MRTIHRLLLIMLVIVLCTGCNEHADPSNEDMDMQRVHTKEPIDQSFSHEMKDKILTMEEVTDVKAVNTEKELIMAFKVKQFDRFQMKTIEKKVKDRLKKQNPNKKTAASSDQKIFLEIEKLENKVHQNKITKEKLKKEMERIKSLSKEQT